MLTCSKTYHMLNTWGKRLMYSQPHTQLAWSQWKIWNRATLHMYRIEITDCSICVPVFGFCNLRLLISKQTHLQRGNRRRKKKCGTHIKKTLVFQCISPHQTKVNQTKHPARKIASKKMHSAEGAQKSYCSEQREEKEEGGEKEKKHSFTCLAPQEVCMPFLLGVCVSLK